MGTIAPQNFFKIKFGANMFVDTGYLSNSIGFDYFMFSKEDVVCLCNKYGCPVEQAIPELESRYRGCAVKNNSNEIEVSKAELFVWTRMLDSPDKNINVNIAVMPNHTEFIRNLSMSYLTIVKKGNGKTILKIPNSGIKEIFCERRDIFMSHHTPTKNFKALNNSFNLGTDKRNCDEFCNNLNKILITYNSDESETGFGYSDVLIPKLANTRKSVIIEIAYLGTKGEGEIDCLFTDKLVRQISKVWPPVIE